MTLLCKKTVATSKEMKTRFNLQTLLRKAMVQKRAVLPMMMIIIIITIINNP
jgi:hypothetical protein